MDEQRFKEALDHWITKEQPMEDDNEPTRAEMYAEEDRKRERKKVADNSYDLACDAIIAYLKRKRLNYGKSHIIDSSIRYIEKMKVSK